MFIGCMVVLSLSCVGLALVPTDAYWALMLLRCLQAFGSASTIALGACLNIHIIYLGLVGKVVLGHIIWHGLHADAVRQALA